MASHFIQQVQHEVVPVADFLARRVGVPFRIPLYQRGYAWEEEQVRDLVSDLAGVMSKQASTDDRFHFFGSVLTVEQSVTDSVSERFYELVDGQQRVTTIILVLRAMEQALLEISEWPSADVLDETEQLIPRKVAHAELSKLRDLLWIRQTTRQGDEVIVPRLTLSGNDNPFFQKLLEGGLLKATTASHRLIEQAYTIIVDGLVRPLLNESNSSPGTAVRLLRDLREALFFRCFLVHMNSLDRTLGYRLFMVLNDRGKPLAVADLLRTRTMELLANYPPHQATAEEAWSRIVRPGTDQADAFLRDFYASHSGVRAPSGGLFDSFQGQFLPKSVTSSAEAKHLAEFTGELAAEASNHAAITQGSWPFSPPQASDWERSRLPLLVRTLRQAGAVPLLMSSARVQDESAFARLVGFLERVGFRYTVSGGHSGTLGEAYFAQARLVRHDPSRSVDEVGAALAPVVARNAPDTQFRAGIQTRMRYTASGPLLKYFLCTVDDHLPWFRQGGKGSPSVKGMTVFDQKKVEIEHIYPRNPKPGEGRPAMDAVADRLGNLTIWAPSDNKAASNSPFAAKRTNYKDSESALTRELASLVRWTAKDVDERERELVEIACRVFEVPGHAGDAKVVPLARAWFVQQNAESRYADRDGVAYEFPPSIANGQQIVPGDVLVCYRAAKDAPDGRRIFGVGRVRSLVSGDLGFVAIYDRYIDVSPPAMFEELGEDPRANRRNAINQLGVGAYRRLLDIIGLGEIDSAPAVSVAAEDLIPELSQTA